MPRYMTIDFKVDGNSRKSVLRDENGVLWIRKLDKMRGTQRMHDTISEHMSCKTLKALQYNVQFTKLDNSSGELAVLCRMDSEIEQLKSVKSYFTKDKLEYDLDTLLSYSKQKPNIDIEAFRYSLIRRLPLDYVLLNVDLHAGNIGFIRNDKNILEPSYIYDMGGSLLSKYALNTKEYLSKTRNIKESIRFGKRNINIIQFIKQNKLEAFITEKFIQFQVNKPNLLQELLSEAPSMYKEFINNSLEVTSQRFTYLLTQI